MVVVERDKREKVGLVELRERRVVMGLLEIRGDLLGNFMLLVEKFCADKVAIDEITAIVFCNFYKICGVLWMKCVQEIENFFFFFF